MKQYDPGRLGGIDFPKGASEKLHDLSEKFPLRKFLSVERNVKELGLNFIFQSAQLEGNTYNFFETKELIETRQTVAGKPSLDATMIFNLGEAYDAVLDPRVGVDYYSVFDLHTFLTKGLLPDTQVGIVRDEVSWAIKDGRHYQRDKGYLEWELKHMMLVYGSIEDPFEKAIYLKLSLCYMQYFVKANERTARLLQVASFMGSGIMPLLCGYTKESGYLESIVHYNETGSPCKYIHWFVNSYEAMVGLFTSDSLPLRSSKSFNEE